VAGASLLPALLLTVVAPAPPREALPGEGFDVIRYELTLTPDLAGKSVAGFETIVLRSVADELVRVGFTRNDLTIDAATVGGQPIRVSLSDAALLFDLPHPVAKGQTITLRIAYHGEPARGVTFSPTSAWTSYFTCDWMICTQDAPGDKAEFALDLRLPAGMLSLAPGTQVATTRPGAGVEVHQWRAVRPYPAYLYGFAVGHFTRASQDADGARLSYLGDTTPAAELQRLFAPTGAMVKFLSGKAGVPLPDGRYAQLLVPGDEAQEAASWSVIGEETLRPILTDPQNDWAIVHELAHQWWGNLVTCATWRDFWLNEGITTFMTAAWKEARFGRPAYTAELDIARGRVARVREQGWDKPLTFPGPYPSLGTRRAVQYSKGALFMDHLRTLLGDAAFWKGLKGYTREHAGGVVTSADLQQAMEQASGKDLSATFTEWVYGAPE
jgi:aminopeptidase N